MKKIVNYTLPAFAMAALLLSSCQPELDAPEASAGSANFSKYVAVGNSLTAGYADGGLYREGQLNSYPAILAEQFAMVGGGEFVQPLFPEDKKNGTGYLRITGFNPATGLPVIAPVTTNLAFRGGFTTSTPPQPKLVQYTGPINNYGVVDMSIRRGTDPAYSLWSNHFERLVGNPGAESYMDYLNGHNATFFTCWMGSNDVLSYATSGGIETAQNPYDGITDTTEFRVGYTALVNKLTENNAKGVLATIPDVTAIPFFTTVTPDAVVAAAIAAGNPANTKLYIQPAAGTVRPAEQADMILLTTQATIGRMDTFFIGGQTLIIPHGFHQFNPLKNDEVLDKSEVEKVQAATINFNLTIKRTATNKGLALADMNMYQQSLAAGSPTATINTYGVNNTAAYVSGNIFSLDGVHPTPRGQALIANEFIRSINQKYGSNIPQVNPNNYRGVKFP